MTYLSPQFSDYLKPGKIPLVIRRQRTAWMVKAAVITAGLIIAGITWRTLLHERTALDVAVQQSQIHMLQKEILHLEGRIDGAAAYQEIAAWALENRGWRPMEDRTRVVTIHPDQLTFLLTYKTTIIRDVYER